MKHLPLIICLAMTASVIPFATPVLAQQNERPASFADLVE